MCRTPWQYCRERSEGQRSKGLRTESKSQRPKASTREEERRELDDPVTVEPAVVAQPPPAVPAQGTDAQATAASAEADGPGEEVESAALRVLLQGLRDETPILELHEGVEDTRVEVVLGLEPLAQRVTLEIFGELFGLQVEDDLPATHKDILADPLDLHPAATREGLPLGHGTVEGRPERGIEVDLYRIVVDLAPALSRNYEHMAAVFEELDELRRHLGDVVDEVLEIDLAPWGTRGESSHELPTLTDKRHVRDKRLITVSGQLSNWA